MLFTDPLFLTLFGAVWAACLLLRPWPETKEWLLIGFSLLLIATWGYYDLVLFLAVLGINFAGAAAMIRQPPAEAGRVLSLLIAADLAALVFFKYANFIGGNAAPLLGVPIPRFPLGIPLAISFYTFHLISYLVDLRKGKVRLATFREYLFYLSFFPHVIAGPIVRAWQLVPQIGKRRRVRTDLAMGLHLLVLGYFLKSVVANNIALAIDPFWTAPGPDSLSALDRWAVAFLYYCQIYGDFAGYSLMALGMARLLGYRLPPNFRAPMLAASLQEFWHRWHITLSRWLRDYLYIPLGGSRVPFGRSLINLIITMVLGGLWHGAGWGFVIWGAMHGFGLAAERLLRRGARTAAGFPWLRWGITQAWVTAAWIFFRSPNFHSARHFFFLALPGTRPGWQVLHPPFAWMLLLALPILAHHAAPLLLRRAGRRRLGWILGLVTGAAFLANCLVASPSKAFIYFRF